MTTCRQKDGRSERSKLKVQADQLQEWVRVKRQCGLTDAHVQMARELRLSPRRLTESPDAAAGLVQRIEALYLRRFGKLRPDSVVPLRQLLHDARVRQRDEAREWRRKKRQSDADHAKAARISLLTIRRMYGGPEGESDL